MKIDRYDSDRVEIRKIDGPLCDLFETGKQITFGWFPIISGRNIIIFDNAIRKRDKGKLTKHKLFL